MITKDEFDKFLTNYIIFEDSIRNIEEALWGKLYVGNLYECNFVDSVGKMLDIFIDSHFTEKGADWIYYYLFEDVGDHKVIVKKEADMFNKEEEIEYHLNSINELWDFLLTDKKLYFKNAE